MSPYGMARFVLDISDFYFTRPWEKMIVTNYTNYLQIVDF